MSATLMILAELILTSLVEKIVLSPGSPITLELPIVARPTSVRIWGHIDSAPEHDSFWPSDFRALFLLSYSLCHSASE